MPLQLPLIATWSHELAPRIHLLMNHELCLFNYAHFDMYRALYDNRLSRLHTEIFDNLPLLQEL